MLNHIIVVCSAGKVAQFRERCRDSAKQVEVCAGVDEMQQRLTESTPDCVIIDSVLEDLRANCYGAAGLARHHAEAGVLVFIYFEEATEAADVGEHARSECKRVGAQILPDQFGEAFHWNKLEAAMSVAQAAAAMPT